MLGNDIKTNLLNPVTVCFNLLERLNINEVIDDYVTIDDRQYHYNFLYFDFEGAVNHWFVNDELDINNTIDLPEGIKAFDIICYSEFKKYYIYNMKKYIYITEKSVNKEFSFITSAREFFRSYNTEHLIDSYQLPLALQMLHYSGIADSSDIAYYFGDTWYINPVFRKPAKLHTNAVINLPELLKMKYNDLLNSALYPKLKQISELVTDNTVIYSNAQIKLLINELANKINIICD